MTMSGASRGRKELPYELRETSVHGNGVAYGFMVDKCTQSDLIMDASSDSDFSHASPITNYDGNDDSRYGYPAIDNQSFTHKETVTLLESTPRSSSPIVHKSLENIVHTTTTERPPSREGRTQAIVEDNQQIQQPTEQIQSNPAVNTPCYKTNQSDPTVPSFNEHSKTSTLRIADRNRSESEDDIEKVEESEPDGELGKFINSQKPGLKTSTEEQEDREVGSGTREKGDEWRAREQEDTDCAVQCLYYTLQCCECVIV